ncbi:MAG: succinyl-diaminopimelate desuccinylase [Actinomycetales bacterium]
MPADDHRTQDAPDATDGPLNLRADVLQLTMDLVNIPSESRHEQRIADLVQQSLQGLGHLQVTRYGNTIVARTDLGRPERVLIGGHLDTVPSAGNLPARLVDGELWGLGACDMKGGVAVALALAAEVTEPSRDVTYVFYECEEVDSASNGLQHLADHEPALLQSDLAILMEPSNAGVEAGCQGTIRAEVLIEGRRAHSARSWMGSNAIHASARVIEAVRDYQPRRPVIDGLEYREGLSVVGIDGGIAGNVIPDACRVTVNFRFAPDRSDLQAQQHVRAVLEGIDLGVPGARIVDVVIADSAPAARPGLDRPAAAAFVQAMGVQPAPKFGWTDVARFTGLGIPALNCGPGDPSLAHAPDERVPVEQLRRAHERMRAWLTTSAP